jgi:hypothetical protein
MTIRAHLKNPAYADDVGMIKVTIERLVGGKWVADAIPTILPAGPGELLLTIVPDRRFILEQKE